MVHIGAAGFVLDGTPTSEWPNVMDAAVARKEAKNDAEAKVAAAPPRIDPSTPIADLMVCIAGILDSMAGPAELGRIVLRTDPLVAAAPECFAPLTERVGT